MESGAKGRAEHPLAVFFYSLFFAPSPLYGYERLGQVAGPMADAAQSLNQFRQERLCTFISKTIPQAWFTMISS